MNRTFRLLLAASAALLCAIPDAFAQYQPVPTYPAAPPPQAQPAPPPAYAPPAAAAPAYPPAPAQPIAVVRPPATPDLELAAFTGWMVNGDVDGIYGKLAVDDSQSFGVSLWKQLRPGTKIELLWIYSNFDAHYDSYTYSYPSTQKFSVMSNWFQIGGVQSIRKGKIEPFAGGTLGAVWFSPDSIKTQNGLTTYSGTDTWRFAITLGGGLNVFLTQSLALRGYARMLVPMYFNGGSVYVGTGGSGMAVNAGIPSISGDFGGALVFTR
jgi:opacity protein-like surface antigen